MITDGNQRQSDYKLSHSAEIQGLRALAVVSVVIYHIDSGLLPGGFVGVDLFFVLSGFLISRKLLAELDESGSVNLRRFTAARARRLLPNAFLVLLTTAVLSVILLPPYRLESISYDIRSAALFYSNFHFAGNAVDYLRLDEPPSPLMHFWSLSIEEQFYLLLPILLICVGRRRSTSRVRDAIIILALVAGISFSSGLYAITDSQPAAFFQTQNRVWQLALGGICGWLAADRRVSVHLSEAAVLGPVLLWGSILLTACSLVLLGSAPQYPGWYALIPTGAACGLLLALSSRSFGYPARILSSESATWIGDRSYSIYLWHWPFVSIAGVAYPEAPYAEWVAAALSFVIACFVYSFVEHPLRQKRVSPPITLTFAAAGAIALACCSTALKYVPLPEDTESRAAEVVAAQDDVGGAYSTKCHLSMEETRSPPCVFGDPAASKTVMLLGDSHAAQWFDAINSAASDEGWRFVSRTKTSCPFPQVQIWYPPNKAIYDECSAWRKAVLTEIATTPPDVIVLASYANYGGWIAENGGPVNEQRATTLWVKAFKHTISSLPVKTQIWIVRDNPQMLRDFSACLSYSDDCGRPREEALRRLADEKDILSGNSRFSGLLDFTDTLCSERFCSAMIDGKIIYRDTHHLRASFVKRYKTEFAKMFRSRK